ncbi:hypothetical protein ACFP8W_12220 [Nocardioides hankookensis]|uniref:Uncharacterized protein n=1 Tax=Nocardioides hankookensis TaxID=443157 RepID=A0ABW1LJC1_9ACTN
MTPSVSIRAVLVAVVAVVASTALVASTFGPASATPRTSRFYVDPSHDATHSDAWADAPAKYRDLGDVNTIRLYKQGRRLVLRVGFSRVIRSDNHYWQNLRANFHIEKRAFSAEFGTRQAPWVRPYKDPAGDGPAICLGHTRQALNTTEDTFTLSIDIGCLPRGKKVELYGLFTDVRASRTASSDKTELPAITSDDNTRLGGYIRIR